MLIRADVRFGSKADICSAATHVRFTPNSDIDCVFRHVRFWPKADIPVFIRSPHRRSRAVCWAPLSQCKSYRWRPGISRRGVFRRSLSRRHNAQAVFPQGKFQQRFERARAINPRFRTEMHHENWPLIDLRIIGQAQPINRDAAFSGTVNDIVTHRLEQPVTATTTALKRWLRQRSPHRHKGYCVRSAQSQSCLHLPRAVTILF
jgi:hypothetical protein